MEVNQYVTHFDRPNAVGVIRHVLPNSDVVVDWENGTRSTERQLNLKIWKED
jgi:hypothetical protein